MSKGVLFTHTMAFWRLPHCIRDMNGDSMATTESVGAGGQAVSSPFVGRLLEYPDISDMQSAFGPEAL